MLYVGEARRLSVTVTAANRVFHQQAKTRLGLGRVCAYLHAGSITPHSTVKPLALASAGFEG